MKENEVLINNIKYRKISSINNHLGQFDVFVDADSSDKNIYFFEVYVVDGNTTYKTPEEHISKELYTQFFEQEILTDIRPSAEGSKAYQLFKERLNA